MTIQHPSGKLVILFLEADSGWGGSSRSLFNMISAIDRSRFEPIVAVKRDGPVIARYTKIGVRCFIAPELVTYRPSERKNGLSYLLFLWERRKLGQLVRRIRSEIVSELIGLVHVNHESLAAMGSQLAIALDRPWVAHCRVQLSPGWFSRRLYRLIHKRAAHIICIARPVREHFESVSGRSIPELRVTVVHNMLLRSNGQPTPLETLQSPSDRFRILSLSNFSPNRGVDRIIDVADSLKRRGEKGFAFYLCGRPANRNFLTGRVAPYYGEIVHRIRDLGLTDMVFLPGHVSEPERALAACDVLIKLTRQSNPWGRDIMEAMGAGLPVITLGEFQEFIENGVNGFVDRDFDAARVADHIQRLSLNEELVRSIQKANRGKAHRMFDSAAGVKDVEAIYEAILGEGISKRL